MIDKVQKSVGYTNMVTALDKIFNNNYEIEKIIPSDDYTSNDFRAIVNIGNITGIDIGVGMSGNSHMFQIGDGFIGISVPLKKGRMKLPSGKQGESLDVVVSPQKSVRSSVSADNLTKIEKQFQVLKEYLDSLTAS